MSKKKIIILSLGIAVLALLAWYTVGLISNKGKSDTELFAFNVEDTASVDRIVILDAASKEFEVIRTKNGWTDKDGNCIIQDHVALILETFKNIEFKGYISENSKKQHIKMMSAQNLQVKIYQNGEWLKTWYIGTATADHYGQVMLLDSEEGGKSDLPVLMKIRGFNGIIEPRFFADARKWQCTNIFAIPVSELKKVEFKWADDPARNFSVKHEGFKFEVRQNGELLPTLDTTKVFRYLNNYKKIHFELPNYVLNEKQIDSVKSSKPFATLSIEEMNGKKTFLKCFRITGEPTFDSEVAHIVNYDLNRFWALLPNGELVKCQYFVFDPLFRGDLYFPMDKSKYKVANQDRK